MPPSEGQYLVGLRPTWYRKQCKDPVPLSELDQAARFALTRRVGRHRHHGHLTLASVQCGI